MFSNVSPCSLPNFPKHAIKMLSAIPNTFDVPLNNSSIFFCNISPTEAALNGSLMYLYPANGQEKDVLKYDDLFYLASDYDSSNLHQ